MRKVLSVRHPEEVTFLQLATIIVEDYDAAITFFVEALDFELVEDSPAQTNDGRPKRWVVVRPKHAETGLLLARADNEQQHAAVGNQLANRVGFIPPGRRLRRCPHTHERGRS